MLVKLTRDELLTITSALDIARIFFEKTKRKEDFFEVDDLARLLFFADEMTADLSDENTTYSLDSKTLKDLLKERDAYCIGRTTSPHQANEQGFDLYRTTERTQSCPNPRFRSQNIVRRTSRNHRPVEKRGRK